MITMMTTMIISMMMVSRASPPPGVDSHRVDPQGRRDTRCQPCLRSLGTAAIGREILSETIKKTVTSYSQDPTPLRQGTVMGKGVTLCKSRFKVKSVGRSSLDESGSNFDSKWKLRLCAQNLCVMNLMSVCMLMAVVPGMQISSGVVPSIRN